MEHVQDVIVSNERVRDSYEGRAHQFGAACPHHGVILVQGSVVVPFIW